MTQRGAGPLERVGPGEHGRTAMRRGRARAFLFGLALLVTGVAGALPGCVVVPGYVAPAPVYVAPRPVYVAPAPVYVYGGWGWHSRRW